jgi:aromatic-L-amino-acid decarboxylase
MTPDEFRVAGHQLIDWIADYRSSIEDRPVKAQVAPGQVRESLPPSPPAATESIEALLADLDDIVVPGTTMVQHPMHYGWFPSNASLSSVLGDIASSGLGGLGISWESCPSLTEVEEVVCDWMRQLTGLSSAWHGAINDTASTSTLTGLLVARERATDLGQNRGGLQSAEAPLVVYSTDQAHSSVAKAALLAGFGWDNIRMVATDAQTHAMDPVALADAMAADVAAGRVPAAVVVTTGTTGVTAMDPVAAIVDAAGEHDVWVHLDAAMAGAAMLLPECRHLWEGVEGVDSVSWNPHKWMGTILDCSLFYMRDIELLNRVMSTNPSYLQSAEDGDVTQFRDWGIPLGRRFRALKLWFHLRLDGVESIQARLRRDLANAQWFRDTVAGAGGPWKVVAPVTLQTVCVRHEPVVDGATLAGAALDEHTQAWIRMLNESGATFLSGSILDGQWMARVSIGVESTERHHLERLWVLMQEAAGAA